MCRRGGCAGRAGRARRRAAREPEVGHAHASVAADEHVLRLEVAVHEAGGVRGGEPGARVDEDRERVAPARGAACSQRDRLSPSTNSMAMNTRPSIVPVS
jgi:hypothetical protein